MIRISLSRCVIATSLALALSGCGGGDDSGTDITPPPTEIFPIVALDGFSVAAPDKTTHIDLTPYIYGGEAILADVNYMGTNEVCSAPIKNGIGFDVTITSGTLCDYQYTVNNAQTRNSALMRVFTTQAVDPILPPLSHAMVLNGADVSFDLPVLLGSDWPDGFSLSAVTVQGEEGNLGTATQSGNIITYTAPDLSGWNRIVYTLANATKPGEDVMGTVYITVSESINQPPLINKLKYNYNVENGHEVVMAGEIVNIDLSTFITEPDDQEWQLLEVQSYTASVTAKNPNSITNKVITFSAGTIGKHIISYVVADHFGGYSFGLIQVTVSAKEQVATWKSLTVGSSDYTAPLPYSDGVNTGFSVTPEWDNQVNNTIAGYNINSAQAYCGSLGTVPSVSDMAALRRTHYTSPTTTGELNKWPAAKPYLVRNAANTADLGYDIVTGSTAPNATGIYYVTCTKNPNLTLTMLTRQVVANDDVVTIATINKAPGIKVVISKMALTTGTDLNEGDVNITGFDSENGQYLITTQSKAAGEYRFKVSNTVDASDSVTSPIITYKSDLNTARLASLNVVVDDKLADYIEENKLTATILDVNNNPVPSQKITVALSEKGITANTATLTIPKDGLVTNASGQVTLLVKDSEAETIDVTAKYTAVAASSVGDSEQTAKITFSGPAYCHQYPIAVGVNCLPYVETNVGIYTASMSQVYALSIGLTAATPPGYGDLYTELYDGELMGPYILYRYQYRAAGCNRLNTLDFLGRTNWRVPSSSELQSLHASEGDMKLKYGWPTSHNYTGEGVDGTPGQGPNWDRFKMVNLKTGEWGWHYTYDYIQSSSELKGKRSAVSCLSPN